MPLCLQDAVSGGRVSHERRCVCIERCICSTASVGGCSSCRLCLWLPLEPDAASGRGALRHAQLRHPVLPSAIRHHTWNICPCNTAGKPLHAFYFQMLTLGVFNVLDDCEQWHTCSMSAISIGPASVKFVTACVVNEW